MFIWVIKVNLKLLLNSVSKLHDILLAKAHEHFAPGVKTEPIPTDAESLAFSITLYENPTSKIDPFGTGKFEVMIISTNISIFLGIDGSEDGT